MSPRLPAETVRLLTRQDNVIATWQVQQPSPRAMAKATRDGKWRRLTPGTYAAAPSDPTEQQELWGAGLYGGEAAMLSGQAALVCHGWKGKREGHFDVLVPASHNGRPPKKSELRIHRTTVMPSASEGGIPRAVPAVATVDAASWARTAREAEFLIISVLNQKLCTPRDLEKVLADRPSVKHRALMAGVVGEFRGGVHSMGELDFSRLCREYGIRKPDRQVWRYGSRGERRRLDVYFDAEGVVVEIDGVGHVELAQWIDDQERQNEVVVTGDRVFLRVSNFVLRYEPEVFMDQLTRALAEGCANPTFAG